MLKSISLKNFRGFRDHTIDFTPFCLLVGQNNAGKTTIIEALRVAAAALQRAPNASFMMAPDELYPDVTGAVFKFSLDTLDIESRGLHYNYDTSEPALIKIRYSNNHSVTVAIGESLEDTYCQLQMSGGKKVTSRAQFSSTRFRSVFVMPPVGALLLEETERNVKYLHKHINGYLSHRHIRNQMADMPNEFAKFRVMLEETWSSRLQVGTIERGLGDKQNLYGLTIRDGPFVSEIALVGSGLQAWIQTVWFLSRVLPDATVVLDEPDVWLHADLQKRLIKILAAEQYRQTIVATHSIEMISDVSPGEIIVVSKRASRSRALSSVSEAQSAVEAIGTNVNIQLSKMAAAGTVVFVEGNDYSYLDQIAYKLGISDYEKFGRLPHFSVGGMNNWRRAAMAAKAFYETSGGKVHGVIFVDRDYKADEVFNDIIAEATKSYLAVKVWSRKEIENYFLDESLIRSYIENRARERVSEDELHELFESVIGQLSSQLTVLVADSYQSAERKLTLPVAMQKAEKYLSERRAAGATMIDLICGKKALSLLSAASQSRWNVSIPPMSLCRHMPLSDVPIELKTAVQSLI